jgi:hypothetical protein
MGAVAAQLELAACRGGQGEVWGGGEGWSYAG